MHKKNKPVRNWTFNIVLLLSLVTTISHWVLLASRSDREKKTSQNLTKNVEQAKDTLKDKIGNAKDAKAVRSAYDEYGDSTHKALENATKQASGDQKKVADIAKAFHQEMVQRTKEWLDSLIAANALDPSTLSYFESDGEFQRQKKILSAYVQKSEEYKKAFDNMISTYKTKLEGLDKNSGTYKGAVDGITDSYNEQKPLVEPLLTAHIELGKNHIQLLELLQQSKEKWSFTDGQFLFNDDDSLNNFNAISEKIKANATTIQTLSTKGINSR